MPNWCDCDLRITGPKKDQVSFLEFMNSIEDEDEYEKYFDLAEIIPYPAELTKAYNEFLALHTWLWTLSKDQREAWLTGHGPLKFDDNDWPNKNWGTSRKFMFKLEVTEKKTSTVFHVLTAWSPPSPVIKLLSERYPSLRFNLRFYECGAGYKGHKVYKKGECLDSMEGDYRGNRGG